MLMNHKTSIAFSIGLFSMLSVFSSEGLATPLPGVMDISVTRTFTRLNEIDCEAPATRVRLETGVCLNADRSGVHNLGVTPSRTCRGSSSTPIDILTCKVTETISVKTRSSRPLVLHTNEVIKDGEIVFSKRKNLDGACQEADPAVIDPNCFFYTKRRLSPAPAAVATIPAAAGVAAAAAADSDGSAPVAGPAGPAGETGRAGPAGPAGSPGAAQATAPVAAAGNPGAQSGSDAASAAVAPAAPAAQAVAVSVEPTPDNIVAKKDLSAQVRGLSITTDGPANDDGTLKSVDTIRFSGRIYQECSSKFEVQLNPRKDAITQSGQKVAVHLIDLGGGKACVAAHGGKSCDNGANKCVDFKKELDLKDIKYDVTVGYGHLDLEKPEAEQQVLEPLSGDSLAQHKGVTTLNAEAAEAKKRAADEAIDYKLNVFTNCKAPEDSAKILKIGRELVEMGKIADEDLEKKEKMLERSSTMALAKAITSAKTEDDLETLFEQAISNAEKSCDSGNDRDAEKFAGLAHSAAERIFSSRARVRGERLDRDELADRKLEKFDDRIEHNRTIAEISCISETSVSTLEKNNIDLGTKRCVAMGSSGSSFNPFGRNQNGGGFSMSIGGYSSMGNSYGVVSDCANELTLDPDFQDYAAMACEDPFAPACYQMQSTYQGIQSLPTMAYQAELLRMQQYNRMAMNGGSINGMTGSSMGMNGLPFNQFQGSLQNPMAMGGFGMGLGGGMNSNPFMMQQNNQFGGGFGAMGAGGMGAGGMGALNANGQFIMMPQGNPQQMSQFGGQFNGAFVN